MSIDMTRQHFDYDLENTLAASVQVGNDGGSAEATKALWQYAYDTEIHQKLVRSWLRKQRKGSTEHLHYDELDSEALLAIRPTIPKFKPHMGSLYRFCRLPVHNALDIYRGRSRAPVQLGQKTARSLGNDLHGEEWHEQADKNPDEQDSESLYEPRLDTIADTNGENI
jgi:hypothetical protein